MKLYIDQIGLHNHWTLYPFRGEVAGSMFRNFEAGLSDRGIICVDSLSEADCVISGSLNPNMETDLPLFVFEQRDGSSISTRLRKRLRRTPNMRLWRHVVLRDPQYYCRHEHNYANVVINPAASMSLEPVVHERVDLAWNLFWFHYFSQHNYRSVTKEIDISLMAPLQHGNRVKVYSRKKAAEAIEKLPNSLAKFVYTDPVPFNMYAEVLTRSKITISPWGNTEIAGRDAQGLMHNCVTIKPDCSYAATWPDIWRDMVWCRYDYSDLGAVVENIMDTWPERRQQAEAVGEKWRVSHSDCSMLLDRIGNLITTGVEKINEKT